MRPVTPQFMVPSAESSAEQHYNCITGYARSGSDVSTLTRGSVGGLGCVCHCIARRLFADNLRAFFTFPEYGNIAWRTVVAVHK